MSTAAPAKPKRQPGVVYKGKYACGWCQSNDHDRCRVAVQNGDGSLLRCACGCPQSQGVRCVNCGERDPSEVGPDMRCVDRSACEGAVAERQAQNPISRQVREALEHAAARRRELETPEQTAARAERLAVLRESRPAWGTCLCCGETTKGGLFLPGHDARFVSTLAELAKQGEPQLADARRKLERCSPALKAKFERKVARG